MKNEHEFSPHALLNDVGTVMFCIGAAKTGTTWLYDQLSVHPDVHLVRKEYAYWNAVRPPYASGGGYPIGPVVKKLRAHRNKLGMVKSLGGKPKLAALAWEAVLSHPDDHDAYAKMLTLGRNEKRLVADITPAYAMLGRLTFQEMHAFHRNTRFVYILRDPVDRLWSAARWRVRAWLKEDENLSVKEFQRMLDDPLHPNIRASQYEMTIRELEAAVPAQNIMYIFYEDLFRQPTIDRLCAFLEIKRFEPKFEARSNKSRALQIEPSQAQFDAARKMLVPTYDFIAENFSDAVPSSWRFDEGR